MTTSGIENATKGAAGASEPAGPDGAPGPGTTTTPTFTGETTAHARRATRAEPGSTLTPGLALRFLRGQTLGAWLLEVVRFCAIGGMAFIVDVGLFNLLRFGPGELLGEKPLTAKVISVAVSVLVAWLGNRYWTFSGTRQESRRKELAMFALVNLGGMTIAVGCLAVSHYVLGLTSPLADNVAANGVGLVLGTGFRYLCYRYVVFTGERPANASQA